MEKRIRTIGYTLDPITIKLDLPSDMLVIQQFLLEPLYLRQDKHELI